MSNPPTTRNDNDDRLLESSMFSSPVAVAVARKKKKRLSSQQQPRPQSSSSTLPKKTTKNSKTKLKPKKNKTLQSFLEGAVLYAICIGVPALLGMIHRLYEQCTYDLMEIDMTCFEYGFVTFQLWLNTIVQSIMASSSFAFLFGSSYAEEQHQQHQRLSSDEIVITAQDTNAISDVALLCILSWTFALLRIIFVQMLVPKYLVEPQRLEALVRCKSASLLSSSYTLTPKQSPNPIKQNLAAAPPPTTMTTTTTTQLPKMPIPSSSTVTPTIAKAGAMTATRNTVADDDDYGNYHDEDDYDHMDYNNESTVAEGIPSMPVLHDDTVNGPPQQQQQQQQDNDESIPKQHVSSLKHHHGQQQLEQSKNMSTSTTAEEATPTSNETPTSTNTGSYGGSVWAHLMADKDVWSKGITDVAQMVRVSSHHALGHVHLVEDEDEDEDPPAITAADNNRTTSPSSFTMKTPTSSSTSKTSSGNSSSTATTTSKNDRLFAAPRYATAVFRLWYSLGLCCITLYWFHNADFWPIYLGGNGHTSNCWDLKGSFAIASSNIDTDFDHANHALKYFFLVQGSYHIHSLCFHLVSMAMLAIYGGSTAKSDNANNNNTATSKQSKSTTRMVSMKSGFTQYLKSLMLHIIAIVMVCGSYFFSSLRRLGAIGMFAFDFSSIFLHLLQLCINAPQDSIWNNNTQRIKWIHRGLVIPTFLYTRFFILPFVVWYSAVFESKHWLQQIERTLFPGIVKGAYILFHGLMLLALILNVIYFRRLLFHPHLKKRLE